MRIQYGCQCDSSMYLQYKKLMNKLKKIIWLRVKGLNKMNFKCVN